jgi:hypothetical protein
MRSRTFVLGWTLLFALLAARAGAVLPRFFPKPPAWTSYLVTADNQGVKDGDFATWVKNAQTAVAPSPRRHGPQSLLRLRSRH